MNKSVIRAGLLFDDIRVAPSYDQAITIADGRIQSIEPWIEHSPTDIPVIDLSSLTVLPGLIDTHLHLIFDPIKGPVIDPNESDNDLLLRIVGNAQAALRAGVTTVCDVGGPNSLLFGVRNAIQRGLIQGPRIVASGAVLTVVGGHGEGFGRICTGIEDARQAVREQVEAGADLIKVMATGGGGEDPKESLFSQAELDAIVDEANRFGLRVAAHCHGTEGIQRSIKAGIHRIEHCTFMTTEGSLFEPSIADELVKRGIFVCPTNVIDYRQIERNYGNEAGFAPRTQLNITWKKLAEHGVKVAASSDAGVTLIAHDDYSLIPELMVKELGLSSQEALMACTQVAAEALGLADEIGTLTEGKQADLIALSGNPLEEITCLRAVKMVIREGKIVHKD